MSPVVPAWQSFIIVALVIAMAWLIAHGLRMATARAAVHKSQPTRWLWLAAGCTVAFLLLTAALLGGTAVAGLDAQVRTAVRMLYADGFVQAGVFITAFGDTASLMAVTATATGLLWALARRPVALGLVVSALGSQLTTYVLKYAIGRQRPVFEAFAHASTPSFPSAHAAGAMAVYGFLTYAVARELSPPLRAEVAFWGGTFVALLAASRVVLGVHFLSDVVAGLLVGLGWLALGVYTAARQRPTI